MQIKIADIQKRLKEEEHGNRVGIYLIKYREKTVLI
ncbi:hypothetical protein GGR35_002729 [Mucilaginibacter phyllosphaerae]|uniref:Uncharacterized protein n=1 Tax=Mucilaginibacter phyllosphaerae TaxID=1812349 RepID=A0ABR6IAQ5_9SPHI|nr:hypothetical protein [Mucilaginibacter phyllosphaerae]